MTSPSGFVEFCLVLGVALLALRFVYWVIWRD